MGKEIEHKFLVRNLDFKQGCIGIDFKQGYLNDEPERTVRVRIAAERAFLTIKGRAVGAVRDEFEYEIPRADAEILLEVMCRKPIIEKTRYVVEFDGFMWEVDEFSGENKGLIVAEIELTYEHQTFTLPPWIGTEVTTDTRYFNSNLFKFPFSKW